MLRRAAKATVAVLAAVAVIILTWAPPTWGAEHRGHHVRVHELFGVHDATIGQGGFPGTTAMGTVRLWDAGTSWRQINPSPHVFDWTTLDRAVATAEAHHARPLLVLGQTPRWAAKDVSRVTVYGEGAGSFPVDHALWVEYVQAVAHRYQGRLDYETWNEVNLGSYAGLSPVEMTRLQSLAYRTIKAIDPGAVVTAPSVTARGGTGRRFLLDFARAGGFDYADAINLHAYPEPDGGPERAIALIRGIQRALRGVGVALPVWDTELNYGLPWGGTGLSEPLTQREQYAFALRTYLLAADAQVRRTYWYAWQSAPFLGVTAIDGSEGARGIETARRLLGGRFLGCDHQGPHYRCLTGSKVIRWNVDGHGRVVIRNR